MLRRIGRKLDKMIVICLVFMGIKEKIVWIKKNFKKMNIILVLEKINRDVICIKNF